MKVLVFPYDQNPYIRSLYTPLHDIYHVAVGYFPTHLHPNRAIALMLMPLALVWKRIQGYSVFHLHFLYPFSLSSDNKNVDSLLKHISFSYTIGFVLAVKLLGYRLVYTVHDITPHEPQTSNDAGITKFLCNFADALVVISKQSLPELKNRGVTQKNIYIIPLGNYIGVYPLTTNKKAARQKLGLGLDSCVFLFFGLVRSYKGVDTLLNVFQELAKRYHTIQLVIAGQVIDKALKLALDAAAKEYPDSVFVHSEYIKTGDVQDFFQAADVAVLPFARVTNSSSVLLPLSLGVPVIYPNIGNMRDIPEGVGFSYEPTDQDGLKDAMVHALKRKTNLTEYGEKGLNFTKTLSWEKIAEMHLECYTK